MIKAPEAIREAHTREARRHPREIIREEYLRAQEHPLKAALREAARRQRNRIHLQAKAHLRRRITLPAELRKEI